MTPPEDLIEVGVYEMKYCDLPHSIGKIVAEYDGKTKKGFWAYMCEYHFKMYGVGLGTGKGQKLIYLEPGERRRGKEA